MKSRRVILFGAVVTACVVTVADYVSGFELSFSIFYLAAISLATWVGGWRWALPLAIFCAAFSLLGDFAAGARYANTFVPWWNAIITLIFYLMMVAVLHRLRLLYDELEQRVEDRTAALQREMAERATLERALLSVSEREQRRIGHDLHDSLCQHLTGVAIATQVLADKLEQQHTSESADASKLVSLIEEAIDMGRSLAHGLSPVELDAEGLMTAFQEFTKNTRDRLRVECQFIAPQPVLVSSSETAVHLFRIGQEAVNNAIKHGRAKHITIGLAPEHDGLELTIRDDGIGLPNPLPAAKGMGMQIMKHRASIIGAALEIKRITDGTLVRCVLSSLD